MPAFKMPTDSMWGPLWGPGPGRAVPSVLPVDQAESFDFRSRRFATDARTLARMTGRSLVSCRQELFIAQGDMMLACELLVCGYGTESEHPKLH